MTWILGMTGALAWCPLVSSERKGAAIGEVHVVRIRSIIALLAAATLAVSLAGCGGDTDSETPAAVELTTPAAQESTESEPETGVEPPAAAKIGDTLIVGKLEVTVKGTDPSVRSQVGGGPYFGVNARWKNVGDEKIGSYPITYATTADGTINDGLIGEQADGPHAGNLEDGALSEDYGLRPGAAREGWLMFKKKPGPLTTLYVSSGVGVGVWDITQ